MPVDTFEYPGVREGGADGRELARAINRINRGKVNACTTVTLSSGTAATTLTDSRLTAQSYIDFMPLTANAAAELAAGTLYVSAQDTSTATLTHANAGSGDRTYRVLIIR